MPRILDLMRQPAAERDVDWLKTALQAAVELELATIPPYLCAMWSVKDATDPVRAMIRDIVVEEMDHMATACNLLTTIGGTPQINTADAVPTWQPLPRPLARRARSHPPRGLVSPKLEDAANRPRPRFRADNRTDDCVHWRARPVFTLARRRARRP